jgi:hypothetical protein
MEYNSQKGKIGIMEYGRNIQKLLMYANSIEDQEQRLAYIERVLDMMPLLNTRATNVEDYRAKLWAHAFKICNYELDVKPPNGIVVPLADEYTPPHHLPYPSSNIRFRHYGLNLQRMVEKAIEMEDPEIKLAYTKVIASFMKMAQRAYNREGVQDDTIKADLEKLSDGKLSLDVDTRIRDISTTNKNSNSNRSQNNNPNNRNNNNPNNNNPNRNTNSNNRNNNNPNRNNNPNNRNNNNNRPR